MLWSIDSCQKGIRWPVSHDCIANSGIQLTEVTYFLKLFADQILVLNWSRVQVHLFKDGIQFAFCLRQKLNYLRKTFPKTSLETFAFGLGYITILALGKLIIACESYLSSNFEKNLSKVICLLSTGCQERHYGLGKWWTYWRFPRFHSGNR